MKAAQDATELNGDTAKYLGTRNAKDERTTTL
jgi:hypothetical protein